MTSNQDKETDAVIKHWADLDDNRKKTPLCSWYGEILYEEDAPREKLIEVIKHLQNAAEVKNEQHTRDIEFLAQI